jgi:very-short-patch-repair endonuclease
VRVARKVVARKLLNRARQMRHEDTYAEKLAWILLRDRRMFGLKFRRQVPIDNYIVDFYCHELRLIVELDGIVHDDPKQIEKDERRSARLQQLGYKILRVCERHGNARARSLRGGDSPVCALTRPFGPPSPGGRGI